jgi:hypothetical protein
MRNTYSEGIKLMLVRYSQAKIKKYNKMLQNVGVSRQSTGRLITTTTSHEAEPVFCINSDIESSYQSP